jgi:polyhydroxybutyrate depolymerase
MIPTLVAAVAAVLLTIVVVAAGAALTAVAWGAWYLWGPLRGYRRVRLVHAGRPRSYLLHVPRDLPSGAADIVIVMHGAWDYARRLASGTRWHELADREGFVVAFAEATHPRIPRIAQAWNAGHCCLHAVRENVDDVGFIAAVRDDAAWRADRRPRRLFLAGYSNGGMLAYRWAQLRPREVAGVAGVAAALWSGPPTGRDRFRPERLPRIPVVHAHGRADRVVPFAGGRGRTLPGWDWCTATETVEAWVRAWGAVSAAPMPISATMTRRVYVADEKPRVVFYEHAAGHSWPGERRPFFLERADHSVWFEEALWNDWQAMALAPPLVSLRA